MKSSTKWECSIYRKIVVLSLPTISPWNRAVLGNQPLASTPVLYSWFDIITMNSEKSLSQLVSYGPCAQAGCQTLNVLGIPKYQERHMSSKLEDLGLKLQTACSWGCHELLEKTRQKMSASMPISRHLCRASIQSPCHVCQKMVSTGCQDGSNVRAPKPLPSRGTFCGPCWKFRGGW